MPNETSPRPRARSRAPRRSVVTPRLEVLEDRIVPSTVALNLDNETGLDPSKYTIYVVGWGQKGGAGNTPPTVLQSNGTWTDVTATKGTLPAYKVGTGPGELNSITLDSTVPVNSGTLTFAYVPKGTTFDGFSYTTNSDGTLAVTQLNNPPFNSFPYSLAELTQPPGGAPTVDVSAVTAFLAPMSLTLNSQPSSKNPPAKGDQVGNPFPNGDVTRGSILSAYANFTKGTDYAALLFGPYSVGDQDGGIINPQTYIAPGQNTNSPLNTYWNTDLGTLFPTDDTTRSLSLLGNDGQYYKGTPTTESINGQSYSVLDFVGYSDTKQTVANGNEFWVFNPMTPDPALTGALGTSGYMVFSGTGVFQDTSANVLQKTQQIPGEPSPSNVALNLELQVDAALNRGVALLGPTGGTGGDTSTYWNDETKWYPKDQTLNLYAQFVHSEAIGGTTIAALPLNDVKNAQGQTMGTAYGFGLDETPPGGSQVPAKYDPLPGGTTKAWITLDPWAAPEPGLPSPTSPSTTTATSIGNLKVSESFTAASQKETVTGQVTAAGAGVGGGSVTIKDFGQSQTVGVNGSGNFSATFTFNLAQELSGSAKSHSITASYGVATVGTTTFGSTSASVNSPDSSVNLAFQLLFDLAILRALGL